MIKAFQVFRKRFHRWWNAYCIEIGCNQQRQAPWIYDPFIHKKRLQANGRLGCERCTSDEMDTSAVGETDTDAAGGHLTEGAIAANDLPKRLKQQKLSYRIHPPLFLIISVICLTAILGQRFYNEPRLDVGRPAPQTIYAPYSAQVEDVKATEEERKAARIGATPVLTYDVEINNQIYNNLNGLLVQGDELREKTGGLPYLDSSLISTPAQIYLRRATVQEWQVVVASSQGNFSPSFFLFPAVQQQAIAQLQRFRRSRGQATYSQLLERLTVVRRQYESAIAALTQPNQPQLGMPYSSTFLDLTDEEWRKTQIGLRLATRRILTQGLPPGLPSNILAKTIQVQLEESIPTGAMAIANQILLSVLQSQTNLVQNAQETRLLAEQAAEAVDPVIVQVRQGEVIVQAGQTITQSQFVLLDYFRLSRREFNWLGFLGFSSTIIVGVVLVRLVERQFHPGLRRRDHVLLLLLTVGTPLLIRLGLPSTNLPAVGLLTGSFYGSALGMTVVSLLSIVLPLGMELDLSHLLSSAMGGLLGGFMAGRMRSREELALLGGAVSLVQGGVYLVISATFSAAAGPVWYTLLTSAAMQSLVGLAWSIVALGLSPYLEHLFDLVTPIRLAELSNPNRPLLKRLATEVPGTFQHTLFVATLAEAAAQKLGCNVELVRAGTLYHDIGKMHDPLGFIENQMGGVNKHDLLDDPWESAEIIKKHVSEGLEMARKCRLPRSITNFIPEHQGTMLISYFYHRAQQLAQEAAEQGKPAVIVREADFRYPGPIPQTKETGIVMLADSCEAALRSLKDATPDDALTMVNRIIRSRWQDNQLVDCGLTRAELMEIAAIFVQVWQQFNHKRIAYPKPMVYPPPTANAVKS